MGRGRCPLGLLLLPLGRRQRRHCPLLRQPPLKAEVPHGVGGAQRAEDVELSMGSVDISNFPQGMRNSLLHCRQLHLQQQGSAQAAEKQAWTCRCERLADIMIERQRIRTAATRC